MTFCSSRAAAVESFQTLTGSILPEWHIDNPGEVINTCTVDGLNERQ